MILATIALFPLAAADPDTTWSFEGDGHGFTTFRFFGAPSELRFRVDADAIGGAVYGLDLFDDVSHARVASFRFAGRGNGDTASIGVEERGASFVVFQPILASGSWLLSSENPHGCRSSSLSWYFAELGHHLEGRWANCTLAPRSLVGVAFAAGESMEHRRFEIETPPGSMLESVASGDDAIYVTVDEFDGIGAEARFAGMQAVYAPDLHATIDVEHGFIGSYRAISASDLALGYEGPTGSATCSCTITAPEAPGAWTFSLDGQQLGSNGWLALGGVDAEMPFSSG